MSIKKRSNLLGDFGNFLKFISSAITEFIGVALFFLSLVTIFVLITYCPDDQSFNTSVNDIPSNILSYAGSYYADLSLQLFGLASYLFSAFLMSFGYQFVKYHFVSVLKFLSSILSIIALSVVLFATTAQINVSGAIGYYLHGLLIKQLEHFDISRYHAMCSVLLCLLFMITCSYSINLKFKKFANMVGLISCVAAKKIASLFKKKSITNPESSKSSSNNTKLSEYKSSEESTGKPNPQRASQFSKKIFKKRQDGFGMPNVSLLSSVQGSNEKLSEAELKAKATNLISVLHDFGIEGEITGASPGPVVTLYELKPAAGIKSSRVIGLSGDIARYMSAVSARVAVIPGRNALGIELPNAHRQTVYLREIFESNIYSRSTCALPIALGKDISGTPVIADLSKMPHLLIAGTTGSGKSVGINAMILSLLYKLTPSECKFIMIDPKMLELSVYDDIPHLLTPVVTDSKKAVVALKWAVKEMESRYMAMSKLGVRNIEGYNSKLRSIYENGETVNRRVHTGFDQETGAPIYENQTIPMDLLPYIVIIVDEMADLMLVAGKDIEIMVQRLAQMARAAGIHLIMATQRPSVDVITGTIKANFPTRVSFQVSSKIDSRTILGEQGAEQLLGQGDMLYMSSGGRTIRIHCPFVSDSEVENIASYLKSQGEPQYIATITEDIDGEGDVDDAFGNEDDPMYRDAVNLILREGKASTSFIQRHLKIGYNRAARIVDMMEANGVVSKANHVGKREIIGG